PFVARSTPPQDSGGPRTTRRAPPRDAVAVWRVLRGTRPLPFRTPPARTARSPGLVRFVPGPSHSAARSAAALTVLLRAADVLPHKARVRDTCAPRHRAFRPVVPEPRQGCCRAASRHGREFPLPLRL